MDRYPPLLPLLCNSWGGKKTEAGNQIFGFCLNYTEFQVPRRSTFSQGSRTNIETRVTHWRGWVSAKEEGDESIMPLINLVAILIAVGVLLWLVNRFIPMAGSIKSILNAVVVIVVVLWLLNVFGLFHSLSRIRVG
jgi:hypothetical protein